MAISYTSKWSDLGGWDGWSESPPGFTRECDVGSAHTIDCTNTLRSESVNQQVVGLGLRIFWQSHHLTLR